MKTIILWTLLSLPFINVLVALLLKIDAFVLFNIVFLLIGFLLSIINLTKILIHLNYKAYKGEGEEKTKKPLNWWLLIIGTTYFIIGFLGAFGFLGFRFFTQTTL